MKWFILLIFFIWSHFANSAEKSCGLKQSSSMQRRYLTKLFSSNNSNLCDPMKVGQIKDFNVDSDQSPTTVESRYRLQRTSTNEYRISFNIDFYEENDSDLDSKTTYRNDAYRYVWRRLANECLQRLGDSVRGPNGEILKMNVVTEDKGSKVPKTEIQLNSEDQRAHSHAWSKNMDCATITHELLHLAGLVDEYKETESGYIKIKKKDKEVFVWRKKGAEFPGYDCRKIATESNIMSSESEHWNNVFGLQPKWNHKVQFCECESEAACKTYFDSKKELYDEIMSLDSSEKDLIAKKEAEYNKVLNTCPVGFSINQNLTFNFQSNSDEAAIIGFNDNKNQIEITPEMWQKIVMIKEISPLEPVKMKSIFNEKQWNAIIFPGCLAKNKEYYQDSANAYRTSVQNHGKGCLTFEGRK